MKVVFCLILVFASNVSFAKKKVLVIDMQVKKSLLPKSVQKKLVEVVNVSAPKKIMSNCHSIAKNLELLFKYSLSGMRHKIVTLKHTDKFEEFANTMHGYHILSLVAHDTSAKIYHLGLRPAIGKDDLKNLDHYLSKEIKEEQDLILKTLKRVRPDVVNISGSESVDVNEQFFKDNGFSPVKAKELGQTIFNKWNDFWKKVIPKYAKTSFVVSAGNGGSDWNGDELFFNRKDTRQTTPSNLKYKNIIVVGSKTKKGRSIFSNFGKPVEAYENGEQVSSFIPCGKHPNLKLTGTSQATAIHTNKIITQ